MKNLANLLRSNNLFHAAQEAIQFGRKSVHELFGSSYAEANIQVQDEYDCEEFDYTQFNESNTNIEYFDEIYFDGILDGLLNFAQEGNEAAFNTTLEFLQNELKRHPISIDAGAALFDMLNEAQSKLKTKEEAEKQIEEQIAFSQRITKFVDNLKKEIQTTVNIVNTEKNEKSSITQTSYQKISHLQTEAIKEQGKQDLNKTVEVVSSKKTPKNKSTITENKSKKVVSSSHTSKYSTWFGLTSLALLSFKGIEVAANEIQLNTLNTAGFQNAPMCFDIGTQWSCIWESQNGGAGNDIMGRLVGYDGTVKGASEITLNQGTSNDQNTPFGATVNTQGDALTCWINNIGVLNRILCRAFNNQLIPISADMAVTPDPADNQFAPAVVSNQQNQTLVVYHKGNIRDVGAVAVTSTTLPAQQTFTSYSVQPNFIGDINGRGSQMSDKAAITFVHRKVQQPTSQTYLQLAQFNNGAKIGEAQLVSDPPETADQTDIASTNQHCAVVYAAINGNNRVIRARTFDTNGTPKQAPFNISINDNTVRIDQTDPSVTELSDGTYLAVFRQQFPNSNNTNHQIVFTRFNADGQIIGQQNTQISEINNEDYLAPQVAVAASGEIIVTYPRLNTNIVDTNVFAKPIILGPALRNNAVTIQQGEELTLTTDMLDAVLLGGNAQANQQIEYTILNQKAVSFAKNGAPTTQFIQQDITQGLIKLKHDGSDNVPEAEFEIKDGSFTNNEKIKFNFIPRIIINNTTTNALVGLAGLVAIVPLAAVGALTFWCYRRHTNDEARKGRANNPFANLLRESLKHYKEFYKATEDFNSEGGKLFTLRANNIWAEKFKGNFANIEQNIKENKSAINTFVSNLATEIGSQYAKQSSSTSDNQKDTIFTILGQSEFKQFAKNLEVKVSASIPEESTIKVDGKSMPNESELTEIRLSPSPANDL